MALAKSLIRQFHEAGGLLIAGTDTPGAALPGWSVHQEMELFVQAGISPMAALQTATLNNAKVLQQDKQLGTVEVGKYADLAVWDRDLYSVETASIQEMRCEMTLFQGKVVYDASGSF